jgi:hypothetical protein
MDHPDLIPAAPDLRQAKLYAALAKAQAAYPAIPKNRTVTIKPRDKSPYSFRYADLEGILSATRKPLSDNGLALVQYLNSDGKEASLFTQLVHADGGSITSVVRLPSGSDSDPKTFGGLVTYYRRYAACPMLGVAADDDLDENGEGAQSEEDTLLALTKNARAEAQRGVESYVKFWTTMLTNEQRKALLEHHEGFKKIADGVDKAKAKAAAKAESKPADPVASGGADPAQG